MAAPQLTKEWDGSGPPASLFCRSERGVLTAFTRAGLRVKVEGEEDRAYWEEWLIGIAWIFAISDASGEKK